MAEAYVLNTDRGFINLVLVVVVVVVGLLVATMKKSECFQYGTNIIVPPPL